MATETTTPSHLQSAIALVDADESSKAIEEFQRALDAKEIDPKNAIAWHYWGVALYCLGKYPEAVDKLRQALKIAPNDAVVHHAMGIAFGAQKEWNQAIDCYRQATRINPNYAEAHNAMGAALAAQNRYDEAIECYRQATKINPNYAAAYNNMGLALAAQQKYDQAIECYRQATRINPRYAEAHNNMGNALADQKQYDQAVECFRQATSINPNYAEAHSNMGTAFAAQKKEDQAIECYRKATEIDPHFSIAYFNWGNSLYRLKQYREAIEKYERATKENPRMGGAYNGYGLALFYLGRYEDSIVQFERAVQFPEIATDAHNNWGLSLQRLNRQQDAADHYRQAVALKPDYARAYNNWGDALSELGKTQREAARAERAYKEAADRYLEAMRVDAKSARFDDLVARLAQISQIDRESLTRRLQANIEGLKEEDRANAYTSWGNALYALRKYDEAILKYQRAIDIQDDFYAYLNCGVALCYLQKHKNAIDRFRHARSCPDTSNPAAIATLYYWWGSAHHSLKQYVEAAKQYEKATQDPPGTRVEPEAEAELKPIRAYAYFGWGGALANQRCYAEAIAKQRKAIELDRDYAYAYHNVASYLWGQGKYKDAWHEWKNACDAYERAKAKDGPSQDADLFQYYGTLLHQIFWQFEEAEAAYKDGLKLKPDHIGIRIGQVNLYLAQRDNAQDRAGAYWKARETYVEARRLLADQLRESEQADYHLQRGELELLMEDYKEAEEDLVKARELDREGDSPDVCINLGVLGMRTENFDTAVKYFQEACRRDPDNLKARAYLAGAYLKANRVDKAESEYQNILAVAPQHVESKIGLGEVYTAMGEDGETDLYEEAIENFNAAVALSASGEASKALREKELAAVCYSRGYARVKLYQAEQAKDHGPSLRRWARKRKLIQDAGNDFQSCLNRCKKAGCTAGDPEYLRAKRALDKLKDKSSQSPATFLEDAGPWVLVALSLIVLLVTQFSFFRGGRLNDVKYYVALTFGSLMFMLAALCLPQLSKFKISGISLEKSPVEKASEVTILKISRGAGIGLNPTLSFFSVDRYAKVKKESEEAQTGGGTLAAG